jgi:hypothetical protein
MPEIEKPETEEESLDERFERINSEFLRILHIPIPQKFKKSKWLFVFESVLEVFGYALASTNLQPQDENRIINAVNDQILNALYYLASRGQLSLEDLPTAMDLWDFIVVAAITRVASARGGFERKMQVTTYRIEQQITEQNLPQSKPQESKGVTAFMRKLLGLQKE